MLTAKKVRLVAWSLIALLLAVMVNSTYEINVAKAGAIHLQQGSYLYVSEPAESAVAIVDPSNYVKLANVGGSVSLAHFAISQDDKLVYATAFGNSSDYLYLISLPAFQVVATIPVGSGAHHLTLSSDGGALYVAAAGAGVVAVIDTRSSSLRTKLNVGGAPQDVVVSSKYGLILVANSALDSVQAIDTQTGSEVTSVSGLGKPVKLSLSNDQSYLVVTGENSTSLAVLNLPDLTPRVSIHLGVLAHQLYLDSARQIVYVGLQNNSLAIVNLRNDKVVKNIPLSGVVMDLTPDDTLTRIYASAGTHITTVRMDDLMVAYDLDLGTVVHGLILIPHGSALATLGSPGLPASSAGNKSATNFTCGG